MSADTLLSRARNLMKRPAVGAAVALIPLAAAVPGRADTVTFKTGAAKIFETSGGAAFGHAYSMESSSGVTLYGDTQPPSLNPNYPAPPVAYLPKDLFLKSGDHFDFTWDGSFLGGPLNPNDTLRAAFGIPVLGYQSGVPSTDIGDVSWILDVDVYSDTTADPDFSLGHLEITGTDLGPHPGTASALLSPGTPHYWKAQLFVFWKPNDGSELSVAPSITLDIGPPVGGTSAPLPGVFWMGGAMLSGAGLLRLWRRRGPAADARPV